MQDVVVVGYTRSPASEAALWRAQHLASQIHVVTDSAEPLPRHLVTPGSAIHVEHVRNVFVERLFEAAAEAGGRQVSVGDDLLPYPALLRATASAAGRMISRSEPVAYLHIVRAGHPSGARGYRCVLAGADGTVGSGYAALAAARFAAEYEAKLHVAAFERRRDLHRRAAFSEASEADPGFSADVWRSAPAAPAERPQQHARRLIHEHGISATWEYLTKDPARVIVEAIDREGYDLLVTSVLGARLRGKRFDHAGRLTLELLEESSCDHLLVLDPVTAGVTSQRKAEDALDASAVILLHQARGRAWGN